jgi:membrane-bound metal-dependent hydrolase YbcI (DUF457 family)
MFIGHFAVALAAKSRAPRPSLGTYVAAAQLLDLLWPVLLLAGVEHVEIRPGDTAVTPLAFVSYPWSHSLLMTLVYAAAAACAYYALARDRAAALFLGAAVASHWLLDALTHRPDLPLTPASSALVGAGLWNSVGATLAVEIAMFAGGAWLYFRRTRPLDRTGSVVPVLLLSLLGLIYLANVFSPEPPPGETIIAWSAMGMWLFVAAAAWGDRHRAPKG